LSIALYRTQLFVPEDLDQVNGSGSYWAQSLSAFLSKPDPVTPPATNWSDPIPNHDATPALYHLSLSKFANFMPTRSRAKSICRSRFRKDCCPVRDGCSTRMRFPRDGQSMDDGSAYSLKEFADFKRTGSTLAK
jgi:hypothetical protein